jgi:hypothetical protein
MYKTKINEVKDLEETLASLGAVDLSAYAKKTDIKMTTQANSTATDVAGLVADFNALLAKLKAVGLMA